MPRLVIDTNVLVSGLVLSDAASAPARLLEALSTGVFTAISSPELLRELAEVLSRPKFAESMQEAGLTPFDIVRSIAAGAVLVDPLPLSAPVVLDDPDDDHVLACALAARADAIVTGDQHLLNLHAYCGIAILSPSTALRLITSQGNTKTP